MKRRTLILGSVAGALGLGAVLRPRDRGQDHSDYFRQLSAALDAGEAIDAALAAPTKQLTVYYWQKVFGNAFQG